MLKKNLIKKVEELERRIAVADKSRDYYKDKYDKEQKKLMSVTSEKNELLEQVRKQTEADLLYISMKIQEEILNGKKKEEIKPMIDQQAALRQQMAAMSNQRALSSGLLGQLGNALGQL